MEQLIQIMLPPLAACLILTGICTYLGLHVRPGIDLCFFAGLRA